MYERQSQIRSHDKPTTSFSAVEIHFQNKISFMGDEILVIPGKGSQIFFRNFDFFTIPYSILILFKHFTLRILF